MEAVSKMLTCSDSFQKFNKTFKFDDFLERVSDLKPTLMIQDIPVVKSTELPKETQKEAITNQENLEE